MLWLWWSNKKNTTPLWKYEVSICFPKESNSQMLNYFSDLCLVLWFNIHYIKSNCYTNFFVPFVFRKYFEIQDPTIAGSDVFYYATVLRKNIILHMVDRKYIVQEIYTFGVLIGTHLSNDGCIVMLIWSWFHPQFSIFYINIFVVYLCLKTMAFGTRFTTHLSLNTMELL